MVEATLMRPRAKTLRVAIASGKGGTGKTTVATNLAWLASISGLAAAYLDCDTEAPNGHLFLRPIIEHRREVVRMIPQIDTARCTLCGQCGEICQFSALVCLGQKVLAFPELCHSCGGCHAVCPTRAISEQPHGVGVVENGHCGGLLFVQGRLNVGEASSPPVIRRVNELAPQADWLIYDAPPGTACPMVETVRNCDFVVLVTEPTPFGLHDLRLALEVVRLLQKECGLVINRASAGLKETRQFCQQARVPILAEIPDTLAIAKAGSEGQLAVESVPGMRRVFAQLLLELASATKTELLPAAVRSNLNHLILPADENTSDPAGRRAIKTRESKPART